MKPKGIASNAQDRDTLRDALNVLVPGAPISTEEFGTAVAAALAEQERYEQKVMHAAEKTRGWLEADSNRRAVVLAGRPYHLDPALLHDIDRVLEELGFAVIPSSAMRVERTLKAAWKPAKRLVGLVRSCADDSQLEVVALRSFGCGYDAVSFDEAHEVAGSLRRSFTELKIDDIADTAHIRIRLRTLAYTSHMILSREEQRLGEDPAILPALGARVVTPDLCSTAKKLVEQACDALRAQRADEPIRVPESCIDCLTDALPFELVGALRVAPFIQVEPWQRGEQARLSGKKVGLLGNPLIVFNADLNDHVQQLLESLGCQVVYPDPALITVEDVRYKQQLHEFRDLGVRNVIYLQSFGCLKGHVQSRGALRELAREFPDIAITVIDYDSESSALNRENRIRLAVS